MPALLFLVLLAREGEDQPMNKYDLMFVAAVFLTTLLSAVVTLLVLS